MAVLSIRNLSNVSIILFFFSYLSKHNGRHSYSRKENLTPGTRNLSYYMTKETLSNVQKFKEIAHER